MTRLWIKNPLASFDGVGAGSADGGVVVEDGWITQCLAAGEAPATPADEIFDASAHVILPGLINTHHHFYQTLTRAYREALDKPLFPWLQALYPVWAELTEDMVAAATALAGAELLLSGCTTAVDHHYVFSDRLGHAIDAQVEAARQIGLRVVLTRGSMSLGQSAGGLPPDSVVQTESEILTDSQRLISRYHDRDPGALCQIALAPCSPFSVTAPLMRDTADLARENDVLLHTHLAETHDETEFCLQQFGKRPLDYVEDLGWLQDRSWFAHGIHFNEDEISRLGSANCGVAHCPSSNMILASGICPVAALERAGAIVGLGVDGSASNDSSNLIAEARQSLLIQRLGEARARDADALLTSHLDALRWATRGGANLLRRPELGRLEVGAAADIALFTLHDLRFSGAQDPLAALVLSGAQHADAVMVHGAWRVQDGALVDVDQAQLVHTHTLLAQELWKKLASNE